MNLTIVPGAATEDVKQIEEIIRTIDESMKKLDATISKLIPSGVETDWSIELKERWERFYNESIKDGMAAMQLSASNLQRAVDAALEYNK